MQYSVILRAFVERLGGNGDDFEKELDELVSRYPNCMTLVTDLLTNGVFLSREVQDLNTKVELLKDCLVQNKLLVQVPAPADASDMTNEEVHKHVSKFMAEDEEIKINDILWHLACDDDMPN